MRTSPAGIRITACAAEPAAGHTAARTRRSWEITSWPSRCGPDTFSARTVASAFTGAILAVSLYHLAANVR